MAAGILTIGFMMVAALFPVGTRLTAITTERTFGTLAADEAVAKLKLYGVNDAALSDTEAKMFGRLTLSAESTLRLDTMLAMDGVATSIARETAIDQILQYESLYPTVGSAYARALLGESYVMPEDVEQRYFWSALCNKDASGTVRAVIFVSRLGETPVVYPRQRYDETAGNYVLEASDYPYPIPVEIRSVDAPADQIVIKNQLPDLYGLSFTYNPATQNVTHAPGSGVLAVSPGAQLYHPATGSLLRVVEPHPKRINGNDVLLNVEYEGLDLATDVSADDILWLVPNALNGTNRYPCVVVRTAEL